MLAVVLTAAVMIIGITAGIYVLTRQAPPPKPPPAIAAVFAGTWTGEAAPGNSPSNGTGTRFTVKPTLYPVPQDEQSGDTPVGQFTYTLDGAKCTGVLGHELGNVSTSSRVLLSEDNTATSGSGSGNAAFVEIDACYSSVFLTLSASTVTYQYGTADSQGLLLSSVDGAGTLRRTASRS